jgi:hypothetical protein
MRRLLKCLAEVFRTFATAHERAHRLEYVPYESELIST